MATPFRIFAALRRLAPASRAGFALWLAMLLVGPLLGVSARAVVADVFGAGIDTSSQSFVQTVAVQPDGQILVGGRFSITGTVTYFNLARLHEDGRLDASFMTVEVNGNVYGITVLPNGQILIVGSFSRIRSTTQPDGGGTSRNGIALLNADGSLDQSFNPNATANGSLGNVFRAIRLASGKYLVGGHFTSIGGVARSKLARLNSNGSVDTTFNAGTMNTNDYVWNFAELPDGNLMICGGFTQMGGQARVNVARLTPDGFADAGFHADVTYSGGGYASVNTVIPQANGSVVITGAFDRVNGSAHINLSRLGTDGTPDAYATSAAPNGVIHWAAAQPDGAVVIGGSFTGIGGLTDYAKLARITPQGNIDGSFVPPSITGGDVYTLARQTDGKILTGGGFTERLTRIYGAALTPLDGLDRVSGGFYTSCFGLINGETKCAGQYTGDGTSQTRATPAVIHGLGNHASVSTGGGASCAVTEDGAAKCWGANNLGELGDGTLIFRLAPVDVIGLSSGVQKIASGPSGRHACAINSAGGVLCWGENTDGQLGDGTTVNRSTPVAVLGLGSGVQTVRVGAFHSCALTISGAVVCWGANSAGSLGDGTTTGHLTPVAVTGLSSGVVDIGVGQRTSCARTSLGAIKCWGANDTGQLGDGTNNNRSTPNDVSGMSSGALALSVGLDHACALNSSGQLRCWGGNFEGQLGDGTVNPHSTPQPVASLGGNVASIAVGGLQSCALLESGTGKCWGSNASGALGDGTNARRLLPVTVNRYAYTVTGTASAGGTITPAGGILVDAGQPATFSVVPATNHHLLGVDSTCGGSLSGSVYTTDVIGVNCTVAATFAIVSFTVTPSAPGGHGTITPDTPQTIDAGLTTTFTLAPIAGYHASVAGTCGGTLTGNVYTTNAITANCTVIASFVIDTFTVMPSVDGGHGSITPDTAQTINFGSTATFTLAPDSGYHASVAGTCAGTFAGDVYTTNAITSDCSVIASFVIDTYTVTPSVTGGHGTITPATPQTINFGATTAFTLTPDSGHVGTVAGTCGGSLAGNVYTTNAIVGDCTVIASFPTVQATLAISDSGDYARYGKTLNYLVTVLNTGATDLTGTISGALPATLDAPATQWICVEPGAGVQCTPSGHGALTDSVILPAGRSVNWLVSAPVRQDAQGPTVDYAVHFDSALLPAPLDSIDTDTLVIFRNSFDHEYDDGANVAPATPLQTDKVILQVVPPPPAAAIRWVDPLITVMRGDDAVRVERLTFATLTWIRLATIDDRGQERTSGWTQSQVGAAFAISIGVDDAGESWLLDTGAQYLELARPKPSVQSE